MKQNVIVVAVERYLTTTTLHGFKYLYTPSKSDRILWACWCVASACCGGVLCAVLWARFTQVPTLLSLRSSDFSGVMPPVGLCLAPQHVAKNFLKSIHYNESQPVSQVFAKALSGKPTPDYQLAYLEYLLKKHDLTLQSVLMKYTPTCSEIVIRCRVDSVEVPCDNIVHRDFTPFGACCIIRPSISRGQRMTPYLKMTELDIILKCSTELGCPEYELITRYPGKGWLKSTVLYAGFVYYGPLNFELIQGEDDHGDGDDDNMDSSCISDATYSRSLCRELGGNFSKCGCQFCSFVLQQECREKECRCSDPLYVTNSIYMNLPPCSLTQLACLRTFKHDAKSCAHCLPTCNNMRTYMSLKQTEMYNQYSIDPLHAYLDPDTTIVINMRVKRIGSHVYRRMSTESWLTLLSSLGGVFNMFLGVGLFSALELLYFLFIRIPIAIYRSLEITVV